MDGSMAMRDEHPWTLWVTGWETVEVHMFIESSKIFRHSAIILAFSESWKRVVSSCCWKSAVVAGLSNCSGGERCFFFGHVNPTNNRLPASADQNLIGGPVRHPSNASRAEWLQPSWGWHLWGLLRVRRYQELVPWRWLVTRDEKTMGGSPTQTRQMSSELFLKMTILYEKDKN